MSTAEVLGRYVRMVVAGSRLGNRLLILSETRLLEHDEEDLREHLLRLRTSGLGSLTVDEAVTWGALFLYAFGRCRTLGDSGGGLFDSPLSADELTFVARGHRRWAQLMVAGSEAELAVVANVAGVLGRVAGSTGQRVAAPPASGLMPVTRLLEQIRTYSPDWSRGRTLRRLVVTAADEMEFERALTPWFYGEDSSESRMTLGAVFLLWGSQIFRRGGPYDYETLGRKLGVPTLGERVAMRYTSIRQGAELWFGIQVTHPEGYLTTMIQQSGGGWEHVALVARELRALGMNLASPLGWEEATQAVVLLPNQRQLSSPLRAVIRHPETREFVVDALRRLCEACSELPEADRTPERLGALLDIASGDARRALAEIVGARRATTVAPPLSELTLRLRREEGEMPRLVVALPAQMAWPQRLKATADRFRVFVRGDARARPVVYLRESEIARRQGVVEYLELPDDSRPVVDVAIETQDGGQRSVAALSLPDGVAVFDPKSGRMLSRIPRSGQVALATEPGVTMTGPWGQLFKARSGFGVILGEIPEAAVTLSVARADREADTWELEAARSVPVLLVEGVREELRFGSGGRIATEIPKIRCVAAARGHAEVVVAARGGAPHQVRMAEGETRSAPGLSAFGLYDIRPVSGGRGRAVLYAPQAVFRSTCAADEVVLEARWSPTEPAQIQVGDLRAAGELRVPVERAERLAVIIEPPHVARHMPPIRWDVEVHARRMEVVSVVNGEPIDAPIFELLRYQGGLRLLGAPGEEVTIDPGYFKQRTLRLDAHGEAFFPFSLIDDSELEEVELGRDQIVARATWRAPVFHSENRIEREYGQILRARVLEDDGVRAVVEMERPRATTAPQLELIAAWKPWERPSALRIPTGENAASGVLGETSALPGWYLCAVTDVGPDGVRRPRCHPRKIVLGSGEVPPPEDELEAVLWNLEKPLPPDGSVHGLRARDVDPKAVGNAFLAKFARDGDPFLEGVLAAFERHRPETFALGSVLHTSFGALRLTARANQACGRATSNDLRLLSLCEREQLPWSTIGPADVERFLVDIDAWDPGAYGLAVDSVCSLRAGLGCIVHHLIPTARMDAFTPHVQRFASSWHACVPLTLAQREGVLDNLEQPDDEMKLGLRIAGLRDAMRRLAVRGVQLERLRGFAASAPVDARLDERLLELDASVRGLAERVARTGREGAMDDEVLRAARYAERVAPILYQFWLECATAEKFRG